MCLIIDEADAILKIGFEEEMNPESPVGRVWALVINALYPRVHVKINPQ